MSATADLPKFKTKSKTIGVVKIGVVENAKDDKSVSIHTYRQGNFTIAEAMIAFKVGKNGDNVVYRAMGAAVRNNCDRENKTIGTRLAVARALRKLAQMVTCETMDEVHTHSATKGNPLSHMDSEDLTFLKAEILTEEKRRKRVELEKAEKRAQYVGDK